MNIISFTKDGYTPEPLSDFTVIDVEWADSAQNICQFGIAVVRNGAVMSPVTIKIQPPGNRYEPRQQEVHHMTPTDTADAPSFAQAWQEIEPYLRDAQVWAHNAACAECSAIGKCLERAHIDTAPLTILDSIRLFSRPNQRHWNDGLGLRECLYAMGLPCEHHHDAGEDALMCAQLILAYRNGVQPDWERSARLMAEYKARKQTEKRESSGRYQSQQLELFSDLLTTTGNSEDGTVGGSRTFYEGVVNPNEDGTDTIDYSRLNTAETNPINHANVVITGFFHVGRKHLREALKAMGANLKQTITKNVQVVIVGERNIGTSKMEDLKALIHNGYNIARISGDDNLDRLLYDSSLTPSSFAIPQSAKKDLNFTIAHFRRHHHRLEYPVNSIASKELYFPPSGFMGRLDLFCQMCGNLGSFGNWDYNPQVNIVVLPNASVEALQRGEKDEVIRAFEAYYNSQRSVTFSAEFITERDILKFVRERIVRCSDDVTGQLYALYLQSAAIDPETDFKYGLKVARDNYEKELLNQGE